MGRTQQRRDEVADIGIQAGDRAGPRFAREADRFKALKQGDRIDGGLPAVGAARLDDRVADLGVVAVGQHVVVGEDQPLAGVPVPDNHAKRPGGDGVMANAHPTRRRAVTSGIGKRLQLTDLNHIGVGAVDHWRDALALRQLAGLFFDQHDHRYGVEPLPADFFVAHTDPYDVRQFDQR